MRLSPARFNRLLAGDVGQSFKWRRAWSCPCVSPSSGAANPTCQVCNGKAVFWDAEVSAWAGMTNQTPQKMMAMFGTYEPGDAVLTIPQDSPLYAVGQYDRIRALNSTNPFSTVIQPGTNDKLVGTIASISRVFWLDPTDSTVIDGGIPTVAADGSMSWTAGAPPAATAFTVTGIKYDEFFVFRSLSSDRNSGTSGLPMKLQARVFDLFGR